MPQTIMKFHDRTTKIGFYLGCVSLAGIVLCFWIEVIARYFLNSPTLWSGSMIAYLLCISIGLAMPELARSKGHIAITIFTDSLKPTARFNLHKLINLISLCICAVAAYIMVDENIRQINNNITTTLGLIIPKYWISVFISYAFISTSLYFLRQLFFEDKASIDATENQVTEGER